MPDREPNFNDRLQAMAARAMLLAAQREQEAQREAPTMYERRASAARANPALQARERLQRYLANDRSGDPRDMPTPRERNSRDRWPGHQFHRYVDGGAKNPAATYLQANKFRYKGQEHFPDNPTLWRGAEAMMQRPHLAAANMLLQAGSNPDPATLDPTVWFNRLPDRQFARDAYDRGVLRLIDEPQSQREISVTDQYGDSADLVYRGPSAVRLSDNLRSLPITQGPPPEGYSPLIVDEPAWYSGETPQTPLQRYFNRSPLKP